MKNCEKINRNQTMITSLDEMIEENSTVRVVDAYVRSLDVEKLEHDSWGRACFITFLQDG